MNYKREVMWTLAGWRKSASLRGLYVGAGVLVSDYNPRFLHKMRRLALSITLQSSYGCLMPFLCPIL